jgi:hypothetical protein
MIAILMLLILVGILAVVGGVFMVCRMWWPI